MKYEWAVVGGGIAGITTAEILTRQGHSCVLIEKNQTLASETTAGFHEWLHTGALFTLIPDRLLTLKYVIGAIDDLLEYYSSYQGMNIEPTVSGLSLNNIKGNWFQDNYINFKFRTKNRKITLPWIYGVARAISLIEKIHQHDWLRRKAGVLEPFKVNRSRRVTSLIFDILKHRDKFYEIETPDFTMNSRNLLRDLMATAIKNGLKLSLSNEIIKINKNGNYNILVGERNSIQAKNVALCNSHAISKFYDINIKTSYAPISIVSGLTQDAKSFVELDYFPKNCINLLTKGNGIGQIGGITFKDIRKCKQYLNFVFQAHKRYQNNLKELHRYNGIKSEITFKNQPRGYLYQIVNLDKNIWALIPGKFTLAFSMAPEFYRTIYNKNPHKHFETIKGSEERDKYVSDTIWMQTIKNNK